MKSAKKTVTIDCGEYEKLNAELSRLQALVNWYEEQFKLSKHRQFGSSSEKSEYDSAQLSIFNEAEILSDPSLVEPQLITVEKHYRKRTRLVTDKLPDELPIETICYELPADELGCPECGKALHVMGQEVRRELKIIPAQVSIIQHVSKTYSCRNCESSEVYAPVPFAKAKMPKPVIKGSFASPEAIAHIATQKFVMGSPLYRQEQELSMNGILLSRQTMSNWLIRAAEDWLFPILAALKEKLLEEPVIHADETTLQVLKEPGKSAQSKSYMWLYRSSGCADTQVVIYEYQMSRKASHPEAFLRGYTGYLNTDGYEGYHKLPDNITVVGCFSHLRRRFDDALKIIPAEDREGSNALVGKRYCDRLFEMERRFASLSTEARFQKRMELSKPIMDNFFTWVSNVYAIPKSALGKAISYALSQRKYLERFLLDGRLEISNNRAERSIKPFVIGRKNWLFANTGRGAAASAVFYSIIETAKENGLNPFEYLTHIFRSAPSGTPVEELLPDSASLPVSVRAMKTRDNHTLCMDEAASDF
jgi:transposase